MNQKATRRTAISPSRAHRAILDGLRRSGSVVGMSGLPPVCWPCPTRAVAVCGILAGAYANVHPKPRPAGHATAPCWKRNEIGGMAIDIAFENHAVVWALPPRGAASGRRSSLFFPLMRGQLRYCCNRADLTMLKYEVQAFPDRARHPRPAGRRIKAAVRSRLGPRNQA